VLKRRYASANHLFIQILSVGITEVDLLRVVFCSYSIFDFTFS